MIGTKEQHQVNILHSQSDEIGRALWQLDETRKRLIETVEAIEPQLLEWQADQTANSISTLLYHIAIIELDWLYVEVLERPFTPQLEALFPWSDRDKNGRLTIITGETTASLLNCLNNVRQALLDEYGAMSIEDFRRPRSFDPYDVTPEWVIFHLLEHEIEHRGHIQERIRQYQELH